VNGRWILVAVAFADEIAPYCCRVAHDDVDKAHKAWRKAEDDFAGTAARYLASDTGDGRLTKKAAIELSELRSRADSRMQRYFKKALK